MPTITDYEFGAVKVNRSALAKYVRLKVTPGGELSATLPNQASVKLVEQLINQSRLKLRKILAKSQPKKSYNHGDSVGKSHHLQISFGSQAQPTSRLVGLNLKVNLPPDWQTDSPSAQAFLAKAAASALKREAKAYLPGQVKYLAEKFGFKNPPLRFNHAKTRWGSCSSNGNLNLNITLMNLPFELIDYVIIHELCHTIEMNHSPAFWRLMADCSPNYKQLRRAIKTYSPYL